MYNGSDLDDDLDDDLDLNDAAALAPSRLIAAPLDVDTLEIPQVPPSTTTTTVGTFLIPARLPHLFARINLLLLVFCGVLKSRGGEKDGRRQRKRRGSDSSR